MRILRWAYLENSLYFEIMDSLQPGTYVIMFLSLSFRKSSHSASPHMTNASIRQFMKFINSSHSMYSSKNPQHSLCLHISSYDLYDGLKIMQYPAWLSNVHAIIQLQSLSCYLMGLSCISEVKTDLLLIFGADYFSSFSPSRIDFPIILLEMAWSIPEPNP